jgi:arsenite methyltransferase
LGSHFAAMQPEYEAMIRSAGIRSGWSVLDAGCGSGSFLPLLAELVGPGGQISALDLAPENVAAVEALVAAGALPCPIVAQVGSVTALPYDDACFDAAWCANTTQYLNDGAISAMLAELRRVVRPGGLVAVKEFDGTANLFYPFDPTIIWRLYDAIRHRNPHIQRVLRTFQLPTWLKRAGLVKVDLITFLSERKAPLRLVERTYIGTILQDQAQMAEQVELPVQDMAAWRALASLDSPSHILNHPDFYFRENHIVVVGHTPAN